jgi:type VI protein secretion system component Hcp
MTQAPTRKLVDRVSSDPEATNEDFRELTAAELDIVAGAHAATPKLYGACCKGTHIPKVTIDS